MPPKKNETEYDKLARQVAAGFEAMRAEMATKADLEALRSEMATKTELEDVATRIVAEVRKVQDQIAWTPEDSYDLEGRWHSRFQELERRVERLEKNG